MYVKLNDAALINEITKKQLQNLFYHDRDTGRTDRFVMEEGELKVHVDYLCPHRAEIENLYIQALETSSNEKEIARIIAKKTGKKVHNIYMYLRNFRFKNAKFAALVIDALKEYISHNNLFYIGKYA